jgi:hypothetical protein
MTPVAGAVPAAPRIRFSSRARRAGESAASRSGVVSFAAMDQASRD